MKKIILFFFALLICFQIVAQSKDTIVVACNGTGSFKTIHEAIESPRAFMEYKVTIYIKNGTYKEKLIIPSWLENIEIVGEDVDKTIITYDDHANINKMGTFRTFTVKVEACNIIFKNITIENNAPELGQAVALHTEGDKLQFINCRFLGNQDTIFTGGNNSRLYFNDCYIEGTTDFIFGPSTVLFQGCTIHCKKNSYITAASTPKDVKYGYVFKKCKITAANGVDKVYLGRPWRPYAYTLFMECEMGNFIQPTGWNNWGNKDNEKTARYYEYKNYGEGASLESRVSWSKELNKREAEEINITDIFTQNSYWYPI